MSKILTPDIVRAELEKDGIIFGLQDEEAWNVLKNEYGGTLDTNSSWANGVENLIIYVNTTADSYDVYVCTHDHGAPNIDNDVYYYENHPEWSDRALDVLRDGDMVWIDPTIWEDMEYDFLCACTDRYEDWFSDKFDDKKHELLDEQYDEYKE
jgi:hypothetical protein